MWTISRRGLVRIPPTPILYIQSLPINSWDSHCCFLCDNYAHSATTRIKDTTNCGRTPTSSALCSDGPIVSKREEGQTPKAGRHFGPTSTWNSSTKNMIHACMYGEPRSSGWTGERLTTPLAMCSPTQSASALATRHLENTFEDTRHWLSDVRKHPRNFHVVARGLSSPSHFSFRTFLPPKLGNEFHPRLRSLPPFLPHARPWSRSTCLTFLHQFFFCAKEREQSVNSQNSTNSVLLIRTLEIAQHIVWRWCVAVSAHCRARLQQRPGERLRRCTRQDRLRRLASSASKVNTTSAPISKCTPGGEHPSSNSRITCSCRPRKQCTRHYWQNYGRASVFLKSLQVKFFCTNSDWKAFWEPAVELTNFWAFSDGNFFVDSALCHTTTSSNDHFEHTRIQDRQLLEASSHGAKRWPRIDRPCVFAKEMRARQDCVSTDDPMCQSRQNPWCHGYTTHM